MRVPRAFTPQKNQAPVSRDPILYGARRTSDRAAIVVHIVTVIGAVKFPTVARRDQAGFAAPCRSLTALGFRRRGDRFLFARIADDRS